MNAVREVRPGEASETATLRAARGLLQRTCSCGGTPGPDGECAACRAKRLRRQAERSGTQFAPPIVHDVLRSPGRPLEPPVRAEMEARFNHDLSRVRVHADERAGQSARAIDAAAYAVGPHIVFGSGQYPPSGGTGRRLLAHEIAHTLQQPGAEVPARLELGATNAPEEREADATARGVSALEPSAGRVVRRTPANKVDCDSRPLNVPGGPVVADPAATITTAENRANVVLDAAIDELDFAIRQIGSGAPVGWPTISDALGRGMRLMGLDPNSRRVWTADGVGTAKLLRRRLRMIRGTIGDGSFFFTCLGPATGTIGSCNGPICGGGADAATCAQAFHIVFCPGFWNSPPELQAGIIVHESSHNFAGFIRDAGRVGNAACYARFAGVVGNAAQNFEVEALCPDPP